jgi:glucan phosphoethanolaminetransferase (alkaline phosphatase superfamily)
MAEDASHDRAAERADDPPGHADADPRGGAEAIPTDHEVPAAGDAAPPPLPGSPAARPRVARRRARRLRRLLAVLSLLGPTLWIVGSDFARRGAKIVAHDAPHRWSYAGAVVESAVLWGALLLVASRRRRALSRAFAGLFVALYVLVFGVQSAFRSVWNIWLSLDSVMYDDRLRDALTGDLELGKPIVLAQLALTTMVALLLVWTARRNVRPRRAPYWIGVLLLPAIAWGVVKIPVSYQRIQASTPDVIYLHAVIGVAKAHLAAGAVPELQMIQRRRPERVPALAAKPARPRNVLFVLQESQRADVTCIDYTPDCKLATSDSNDAAPGRRPFFQMRSNASSTSISVTTLWAGLRPTASLADTLAAPLLWDYAHAAGYRTAYVSGQSSQYANIRLLFQDTAIDVLESSTHIDTESDFWVGPRDFAVSDWALAKLARMREPFYAVVHYSNIHAPRVYDRRYAPFQPIDPDHPSPTNEGYKNYYKDVVLASDLAVGRLLRGLRGLDVGRRTVVVFTSDHGESYHERPLQGDHAGSPFDEEIRVPTWIDAPAGTLTEAEDGALASKRSAYLWHVDVAPTILDLLGLWDEPALEPFKKRMMGHPLTRPELTTAPVPISNVAWSWEYRKPNWGVMQGPIKVLARDRDLAFHCYDVASDPSESRDLGRTGRCAAPWAEAERLFPVMPPRFGRLKTQAAWGDR